MCGYCSQLGDPAIHFALSDTPSPDSFWDLAPELRGEALLALLIRLLYGVNEGRLELLRGERLWPVVLGQVELGQARQELPPTEHFDFGCLACSSILRLHMDLRSYVAQWTLLLDHRPRSR